MSNSRPMVFQGMKVIIQDDRIVERSLKERLLSLPWRPFKKQKIIKSPLEKGQVIRAGNTIVMQSDSWRKLQQATKGGGE